MNKKYVEIGDATGHNDTVFDITPDLAEALIAALRNLVGVEPPRHAQAFDELTETISQASHVIQHLEAFRELAIVAADRTGPYADRKVIAVASAMPPSRLYRVLEKHGQPRDRKAQTYNRTTEK
jgi:D-alanyl-D-alanine dipeptidase